MEPEWEYDREWEKKKQDLLKFCMEGEWRKVVKMYDECPNLQNAKLSASGETAVHIAVWESTEDIVKKLVESIDKQSERRLGTLSPLWMPNDRGNMPLHLAALRGNVGMCECIAGKHVELVGFRNNTGETPLFLATLRGKKDAFLYLCQICGPKRQHEYYRRERDGQTILHVAIIGEYFDLAYEIICMHDELIYAADEKGYTPLHLLASKPSAFRSGCRLDGFIGRIIYHCLHVDELKNEPVPISSSMPTFKGKEKPEKYPENYKTCINFFQPLLKMLQNMIKRPAINRENLPTSMKHMEANEGNIEDPKERKGDTPHNQVGTISVHLIAWLFGLRDERRKMQRKKEKNIWSVQIMNRMLNQSSDYNSSSGCHPGLSPDSRDRYTVKDNDLSNVILEKEELSSKQSTQGREPPILLAAKNGITEMVERILKVFPMAILDKDSDGKNTVLLAVENRQTKLYEHFVRNIIFYESAFRAVDNEGNSALHVAATLGDYRPYPFAALQMQWEIKLYKYVKHSVPRDLFMRLNNKNMTPKEVFRTSHKDLVKEGAKWLTETSNSCSLVATLVTTVAFATTASVPGGIKEGSSRPNLERHPGFFVFAISSLIALSFSVTSVIAFLSILTSRYDQKDFGRDLPKKLLVALTCLFLSLAAMLVCFCAGHFFLVKDQFDHTTYLVIYAVVCLPVAYFAMMQFPFYFALIIQTFKKVPQRTPFR